VRFPPKLFSLDLERESYLHLSTYLIFKSQDDDESRFLPVFRLIPWHRASAFLIFTDPLALHGSKLTRDDGWPDPAFLDQAL